MPKSREVLLKNIASLLHKAKWNAADLARASGMSPQQLNGYINEDRAPSLDVCDRISGAFGITTASLLDDKTPRPDPYAKIPHDILEILAQFDQRDYPVVAVSLESLLHAKRYLAKK